MRTVYWKVVSWMSALAFIFALVPYSQAQCGLSIKPVKPAGWQLQYRAANPTLLLSDADNDQREPIVGMWHVIFTGKTMNGAPFSGVVDNSLAVWHSDGTEIMNSARPAQDGNFCLGVWTRTGDHEYYLNHIPWMGNDMTNAPSGIGNPQGGVQITQRITLDPNGNSYSGTFKLVSFDTSGNVTVIFTGTLKAKRVTFSTPFRDLLN